MILIISTAGDLSTNEVMEWLHFCNKDVLRINREDNIQIGKIDFAGKKVRLKFRVNNGKIVSLEIITAFWYRRGDLLFQGSNTFNTFIKDRNLRTLIFENLKEESKTIRDLLYYLLENNVRNLGSFYTKDNNKLIHINYAKELGIDVPDSLICTQKKDLIKFFKEYPGGIITKPISEGIVHFKKNKKHAPSKIFAQYVNEITADDLEYIPETFFPTLIQEKIKKKIELRIFYLKGVCYSMAIFSQKDKQTQIDFRRYNKKTPNYRVPFNLPLIIQHKLKKFMDAVDLDTGSIDMVYSSEGKYYFLEVNPVGQFGMVSYPCNYKLEREIAFELSKNDKN